MLTHGAKVKTMLLSWCFLHLPGEVCRYFQHCLYQDQASCLFQSNSLNMHGALWSKVYGRIFSESKVCVILCLFFVIIILICFPFWDFLMLSDLTIKCQRSNFIFYSIHWTNFWDQTNSHNMNNIFVIDENQNTVFCEILQTNENNIRNNFC